MQGRLQPYVREAAALREGGCSPTCGRLQPYLANALATHLLGRDRRVRRRHLRGHTAQRRLLVVAALPQEVRRARGSHHVRVQALRARHRARRDERAVLAPRLACNRI